MIGVNGLKLVYTIVVNESKLVSGLVWLTGLPWIPVIKTGFLHTLKLSSPLDGLLDTDVCKWLLSPISSLGWSLVLGMK